jgi:signal transduction histidine kinase
MVPAAVIGVLVAQKRPANPIGWTFAAGALLGSVAVVGDQIGTAAMLDDGGPAGPGRLGLVISFLGLYACWSLLGVWVPLQFPDRRLDGPFRRVVAWASVGCATLWGLEIFDPQLYSERYGDIEGLANPIAIEGSGPVLAVVTSVGLLGLFGAMFVAIASLVPRTWRARGAERQQMKIVAYTAVVVTVVLLIVANLDGPLAGTPLHPALDVLGWAAVAAIPASLGVAILRYRLYDVDVVINRTFVYASMVGFVTAVYVAVVVGVGSVVGRGREPHMVLSLVATILAAVAFQPVRERVQRLANRLVYGRRASPYEVIAGFSRRLAGELSLADVLPHTAEAAARGVGASAARVSVDLPSGEIRSATWPEGAGSTFETRLDVTHQGERIGELAVAKPRDDPLTEAERTLLADLASQAGIALRNVQLAAELQVSLDRISGQAEELRRSSQRIVEAQDEERRRVERDLHDGANSVSSPSP